MVFLDANIVLELLLPYRDNNASVIAWLRGHSGPYAVSMLTVHLAHYIGRKEGINAKALKAFLDGYIRLDLLTEDYTAALQIMADNDLEDALQVAVAVRCGCESVLTLDKKMAERYGEVMRIILLPKAVGI